MWEALIPAIMSVLAMMNGGGSASTSSATTDPAIQSMMNAQSRRTQMQDPLFEAVTRMAMGLLPKQYQQEIIRPSANRPDSGTTGTDGAAPTGTSGVPTTPGGPITPRGWQKPDTPWSSPEEIRKNRREQPWQ